MKLLPNSWKSVRSALVLAPACVLVVLILPSTARSQLGLDPCCALISAGLDSISGLLKDVVAKPLASIQQIEQQAADFERQVVWPVIAINQARRTGRSSSATVRADASTVSSIGVQRNPAHAATARTKPALS